MFNVGALTASHRTDRMSALKITQRISSCDAVYWVLRPVRRYKVGGRAEYFSQLTQFLLRNVSEERNCQVRITTRPLCMLPILSRLTQRHSSVPDFCSGGTRFDSRPGSQLWLGFRGFPRCRDGNLDYDSSASFQFLPIYVHILLHSLHSRGGQLDILRKPHFTRLTSQEPCIKKIFFRLLLCIFTVYSCKCSSAVSFISLLSVASILKRNSCACELRECYLCAGSFRERC